MRAVRLLGGVGLLALMVLNPGTARAHAELLFSNPAANASLPIAPERLTLAFSEPIDVATARIAVLDARRAAVAGLGAIGLDAAGSTAIAALPSLEPGLYTVSYQVTSATDGHVTAGAFVFLVDPTGTQPAPSVPTETSSPSSGWEVVATRWLALASALALTGIVLFWLVSARPALATSQAPVPSLTAPWGVLALLATASGAGLTLFLTLSARRIVETGAHVGHGSGFALDFAAPFGWTPFAIAMRVALLAAGAAFVVAVARFFAVEEATKSGVPTAGGEVRWLMALLALATLTLAGSSLAGHPAALGGPLFAAVDFVHLLGVAAWLGTLPGLLLLAVRAREAIGEAFRRHSRVALVAAPAVVLTGLANSPLVLGGASRELVASGYGNLLLGKALLFSTAVGIGAVNFLLVRAGTVRRALPLIGVELAVGTLAVIAAAGMVTGQPAASRAPMRTSSAIGTAHLYGTAGASSVHVAVSRPTPGSARYQVAVADAATGLDRTDVQRVILVFTPPAESGLSSDRAQLESADERWLWGTSGAYTPVVGTWRLEVIVRRIGAHDEMTGFDLAVVLPLPPQEVPPPDVGVGVPLPLAALWTVLPVGPLGWVVPVALLGLAAGLSLLDRTGRSRWWARLRVAGVLVAVLAGVGVASRAAVQAANQPPARAASMANPQPATGESIQRGRNLYLANCAACHGPGGSGDGVTAAGWLPPLPPLGEVVPSLRDGELAYRIAVGSAGTRMPAFAGTLSENDRWDLVNHLRTLWPRDER